jgi:LacI family transcriptional regulator
VAKAPTVYDVAQRAGVSIATVSFTFRRPNQVKPSTREAVLAAARALGYVPSANARGLARGRTGAFGLFALNYLDTGADQVPPGWVGSSDIHADEPIEANAYSDDDFRRFPLYVDEIQRGVGFECWRRGYALMIGAGSAADSRTMITDIAGRVDGLAVLPHTLPEDVLGDISRRMPVIALSEPPHRDGLSHVTVDNQGGMRALTDHLIAHHRLRKLLFVGPVDTSDGKARFAGFRAALRAAALPIPRRPLTAGSSTAGAELVAGLLARQAMPQALVCEMDELALSIIDALKAAGIAVPGQVAVTGFDGLAAGVINVPTLTTVRQPMLTMGREVVRIFDHLLNNPDAGPIARQFPAQLIIRESCGCGPEHQAVQV